jgi:hypothetical protein
MGEIRLRQAGSLSRCSQAVAQRLATSIMEGLQNSVPGFEDRSLKPVFG